MHKNSSKKMVKGLNSKANEQQFNAFLQESISSEDSEEEQRVRGRDSLGKTPWWMEDNLTSQLNDDIGTGKSFLKKSRKVDNSSHDKKETLPDVVDESKNRLKPVSSQDEMNDHQNVVPPLSLVSSQSVTDSRQLDEVKIKANLSSTVGPDTIDEIADKERFFKELEEDQDVNYAQLNREFDNSSTLNVTKPPPESTNLSKDSNINGKLLGKPPSNTGKNKNMLSKVALIDSLDSTFDTRPSRSRERDTESPYEHSDSPLSSRSPSPQGYDEVEGGPTDPHGNVGTFKALSVADSNTAYGYSNTSHELEALQKAMRQVGLSTTGGATVTQDLSFLPSSTLGGDQSHGTATATGNTGLSQVFKRVYPDSQTVDEVIKEVEGYGKKSEKKETHENSTPDDSLSQTREVLNLSPIEKSNKLNIEISLGDQSQTGRITKVKAREKKKSSHPVPTPRTHSADSSPSRSRSTSHSPTRTRSNSPGKSASNIKTSSKYAKVKSSGYGVVSAAPSKIKSGDASRASRPTLRSSSKSKVTWSPMEKSTEKPKEKLKIDKKLTNPALELSTSSVDPMIYTSIQSFANYIQDHLNTLSESKTSHNATETNGNEDAAQTKADLEAEVRHWQEMWREERAVHAKLKMKLEAESREFKRREASILASHNAEITELKQENFVLTSKMKTDDSSKTDDGVANCESSSRTQKLEAEIQEQEKLIAGYQQENERIYKEMKNMQKQCKNTEENMFRENQKLKVETQNLREQLSQKEIQLKNKGLITGAEVQQKIASGQLDEVPSGEAVLGASRIAYLESQIKSHSESKHSLQTEIESLKITNKDLRNQNDSLAAQLSQFEQKICQIESFKSQESKAAANKTQQEIERLNRKLKWYSENQQLLDKDRLLLEQQEQEISELKRLIDQKPTEVDKERLKRLSKEKTQDTRRIQDLQRQVRELENIVRKRYPNSVQSLMWAAANTPDVDSGKKTAPSVDFLEQQVKRQQKELDEKDEESKKSLRLMEQKYNNMKFQFEERIHDLEDQLQRSKLSKDLDLKDGDRPHTHATALQQELDAVKQRNKTKVLSLEKEISLLQKQINDSAPSERGNSDKAKKKTEEQEMSLEVLRQELRLRETEVQDVNSKMNSLLAENQELKTALNKHNKLVSPFKSDVIDRSVCKSKENLVADEDKSKMLGMQFDLEQARVENQKILAESEAMERKLNEHYHELINAMRVSHQNEVRKILTEQVKQNSTSKQADMQSKLDTQEVMIRHLKEQMNQWTSDKEQLSVLKIRETALESQIKQLLDELKEAKKFHSPEMVHYETLLQKTNSLEQRLAQRESDIRQLLTASSVTRSANHTELEEEISLLRKQLAEKNSEIERFRIELDSMLQTLRELQHQGLPLNTLSQAKAR